jgi:hypothetical protein
LLFCTVDSINSQEDHVIRKKIAPNVAIERTHIEREWGIELIKTPLFTEIFIAIY